MASFDRLRRLWTRARAGQATDSLVGRRSNASDSAVEPADNYAGDFAGAVPVSYDPHPGDLADPGEVVWTWVPYEEDHRQGKDRPVLVVGKNEPYLLALPLTSKDHHRDAEQEARAGRHWCDVGSGAWDRAGRPSEVRVDRVLQIRPNDVRRIGATLQRSRFDAVVAALQHWRGSSPT